MLGERSFALSGLNLWNRLPDTVKEAGTTEDFKHRLRTHLFLFSCPYFAYSTVNMVIIIIYIYIIYIYIYNIYIYIYIYTYIYIYIRYNAITFM